MQSDTSYFFKKLFWPLALLLGCLGAASIMCFLTLSTQKEMIEASEAILGHSFSMVKTWLHVGSAALFAILIVLFQKTHFRKIFKLSLVAIAICMLFSIFIFGRTKLSYAIWGFICPKFLLFLAWGYANHVTTFFEGRKFYFLLILIGGLIIAPFTLAPMLIGATTATNYYIAISLSLLVAIWFLEKWIHRITTESNRHEDAMVSMHKDGTSIVLFGIILATIQTITLFSLPMFTTSLQAIPQSSPEYVGIMAKHSMAVGGCIFILSLASVFVGPKILERKGWRFSVVVAASIVGAIALLTYFSARPLMLSVNQGVVKGLYTAWFFPLVQIALLTYIKQDRWIMLGWIILVIIPVFESLSYCCVVGRTGVVVLSVVFAAVTIICAKLLAKRNIALS